MAKEKIGNLIGSWAFLIGIILAIAVGIYTSLPGNILNTNAVIALVVIGLIVGLLNVTGKESIPFLLSGLVLVIVGGSGVNLMSNIKVLPEVLYAIIVMVVPATIIVAIKNVFSLAKN